MVDSDFTEDFSSTLFNLDNGAVEELLNVNSSQLTNIGPQFHTKVPSFQLRKAQWNGETRWIKIPLDSDKPLQYEDFIAEGKF